MLRRLLLVVGSLLVLGFCFCSGLIVGLVSGNRNAYHLRYLEERGVIAPIVAADPAFKRVEVEERSDGGVSLVGEVPTQADLDRLRGHVVRAVGEPRAQDVIRGVAVSQ